VPVNVLFTVFWFIGSPTAQPAGQHGWKAGVAAVAGSFLALTFVLAGAPQLALVCAAMAGAALGFLRYNFPPASIFMGDSGSLALGALIASLGAAYPGTVAVGIVPVLFVPVFVAAIPILDTLLVTTTRTLAGRPVSVGGRDHTTHRLYAMGLSEKQVALLLHAFAASGGALALGLSQADASLSGWLGLLFLVGLGLLAVYLGGLHTYQPGEQRRAGG
jgi:UDP-GlcNAc:undecaprenyl-phosphate GlcNAc-1-phosphate transferase